MASTTTTLTALERNWDMVNSAVDGIGDATLSQRPNDQSNSMSWLIWHMSRVVDRFINSRLLDAPQLWTDGGWSERFGMAPDPDEFGIGWTSAQVEQWQAPSPRRAHGILRRSQRRRGGIHPGTGRRRPGARDHYAQPARRPVGVRGPGDFGVGQHRPWRAGGLPAGLLPRDGLVPLGTLSGSAGKTRGHESSFRFSGESRNPRLLSCVCMPASWRKRTLYGGTCLEGLA